MGVKNWIARRAGKRARKKWDKRNEPIKTPRYRRQGTRMVPIKEKPVAKQPTREDYSKKVLGKKVTPAVGIVAINVGLYQAIVNFIRGFKPGFLWEPEQDMEVLAIINSLIGGAYVVWVAGWDWKKAWFDRPSKSRFPG